MNYLRTFALVLCITSCRSAIIYHPDPHVGKSPADVGLKFEDVDFMASDKVVLNGWWIPSGSSRGTVLLCHGNGGNISHRLALIKIFHGMNLDVFIFDYRGYGRSNGTPDEKGTYLDAVAAWEYLAAGKKIPPGRIVVFGESLGGSVAAYLTTLRRPALLIIQSTFTSIADVVHHHYSCLPSGLLVGNAYPTVTFIKKVTCPVIFFHSRNDELVPFSQGEELHRLAAGPKEFIEIHGSHNGGFFDSLDIVREALNVSLQKYLMP